MQYNKVGEIMENYLSRSVALEALHRMKQFENNIEKCFRAAGLSLRENLGRRNGVLSGAQEAFFAEELSKSGISAVVDGRTGEPDITLVELERELECKLTSGSGGTWSLQTDYATLRKKAELDYLYVLASPDFDKFAVLHFKNLSVEDFYPPAPGAREKARMRKDIAMERCNPLVGEVINRNLKMVDMINHQIRIVEEEKQERLSGLNARLRGASTKKKREKISGIISRESQRYEKKLLKLFDRANYWKEASPQFSIELEKIS